MKKLFTFKQKWNKKDNLISAILLIFFLIWMFRSWFGYEILNLTSEASFYWSWTKLLWIPFTLGLSCYYFSSSCLINLGVQKFNKNSFKWFFYSLIILVSYLSVVVLNSWKLANFKIPYNSFEAWFEHIITIAFGEELLFRGFIFAWLETKFYFIWAILISSVLFSAIHYCWWVFAGLSTFQAGLSVFATGIVLGVIRYYSKNILHASFIHFLFNYILEGLGF